MQESPIPVHIDTDDGQSGVFTVDNDHLSSAIWTRLKLSVRSKGIDANISGGMITMSWPDALTIVREISSKSNQSSLNFRLRPNAYAAELLESFAAEVRSVRAQKVSLNPKFTDEEISNKLRSIGFTRRELKPFQLRDLSHLLSLSNGANFSVPGAGKTTVTFALHLLTKTDDTRLFVVAPKAANQAWLDIVGECMEDGAPAGNDEAFIILDGSAEENAALLSSQSKRFIISYDLMIRQQGVLSQHFATKPTHLVLDESHRMKAGWKSQRGAFLLNNATLPVRRDILSGTPMPQSAADIESQLDFLWPGQGLGLEVIHGKSPRSVLGNLYVRTTKQELGLPEAKRHFIDVDMNPGQLALYSIVRNEFLRDHTSSLKGGNAQLQLLKARRSVMRLLQLSINPVQALSAMSADTAQIDSAIIDQVLEEGNSSKMNAVIAHARQLAAQGEKCVIWTIFTQTIHDFVSALADLNPVFIHGGVKSGEKSDPETREGKIKRFHEDENCHVLVANPAAAGEGISLHKVCHNAIYADRSYVSTHYLQSIDRIHRLGLAPDQETNIYVYRSKAPPIIGSVDNSVSRRLIEKIRNMQELLDDDDLHQIALDEEEADDPISYDVELQDVIDLVAELEGKAGLPPMEEP